MVVARGTALPYPLPPGVKEPDADTGRVTITAAALAEEWSCTPERAGRVRSAAARAVLDYAPAAPTEMLNEAVVRFGGYLVGSDYGGVRQEVVGPRSVEYVVNHAAAFRNSGAAALLTRYRVRRAGSIG